MNLDNPEDVSFFDTVARLDDAAIDLGVLTPTRLIGSFRACPVPCRYPRERSPQRTAHEVEPMMYEIASVSDAELDAGITVEVQLRSSAAQPENLSAQVIALQQRLQAANARYCALRGRKAVRGGLALADRMTVIRGRLRNWRPAR